MAVNAEDDINHMLAIGVLLRHLLPKCLVITMPILIVTLPASAQQIWFSPRGPDTRPVGQLDWDKLFKNSSDWSLLASHINVFVITAGYVIGASDKDLELAARDLKMRRLEIAISLQSIARFESDHCGHEEGYELPQFHHQVAEKLYRLGITPAYLSLDEPITFGHNDKSPEGCKLPISEVVRRVVCNLKQYLDRFPRITIGSIETVPGLTTSRGWQSDYTEFAEGISNASGRALTFLHSDVDWRNPDHEKSLLELARFARSKGKKFGIIYNGDGLDNTDLTWVAAATTHFEAIESTLHLIPDQSIIATWNKNPTRILPENFPGTLGNLIFNYRLQRTFLNTVVKPNHILTRLTDERGRPVKGVRLDYYLHVPEPEATPTTQVITGVVPTGATFGIIGLRINTECNCAGENDLIIGDFNYLEDVNRPEPVQYSLAKNVRSRLQQGRRDGTEVYPVVSDTNQMVHLKVHKDQRFGVNSDIFHVTPAARFTFSAQLSSLTATGMFGSVIVIWLDAKKQGLPGLEPTKILLTTDWKYLKSARTDISGQSNFNNSNVLNGESQLKIRFAGDNELRGASEIVH